METSVFVNKFLIQINSQTLIAVTPSNSSFNLVIVFTGFKLLPTVNNIDIIFYSALNLFTY